MWQKKGKGPKYAGSYVRNEKGERRMVLVGYKKNGEVDVVTAESWQMLKEAKWVKV